jgi:hypothetical protein
MSTPTLPLIELSPDEQDMLQLLQAELIVAVPYLQLFDAYY